MPNKVDNEKFSYGLSMIDYLKKIPKAMAPAKQNVILHRSGKIQV
jgi:hypothetical protein